MPTHSRPALTAHADLPLTDLYTWAVTDPEEGWEQTLLVDVPGLGRVALVTRQPEVAFNGFAQIARQYRAKTGYRVRLLRWTAAENLGELD